MRVHAAPSRSAKDVINGISNLIGQGLPSQKTIVNHTRPLSANRISLAAAGSQEVRVVEALRQLKCLRGTQWGVHGEGPIKRAG